MIKTDNVHINNSQSGVVSIFTVIFFMIFISVIVVGFIKVVTDEQRQATDNDLSSSALASAQSGAEDGKRLLLFCNAQSGPRKVACDQALADTSCDAITSRDTLTEPLDIDVDQTNGRREGIVSTNPAYEQRYTCMTIATKTNSVEDISVENGTSELIPLSGVGNFDRVQFSWHATADDRDKKPTAFVINGLLHSQPDWTGDAYPAAMRLEFIAFQKNNLRLDDLDGDTHTLLLLPGVNRSPSEDSKALSDDARSIDPNLRAQAARPYLAKCNPANQYACTMKVNISGAGIPNTSSHNYFLRVSAIYGSAYIKAELQKNDGSIVQFDGVQPVIDVTGRANDVFRRIQTRVLYESQYFLPQYALESGARICKDMLVTDQNATSADNCL